MEDEDFNCCGGAKFQAAVGAVVDFAAGVGNAIGSDMTGANPAGNYTPSNSAAYNAGVNTGHVAAIVQGAAEGIAGTEAAIGGTVATVGSGGTASLVSVPVAALGAAVAVHGAFTINNAVSNLLSGKGMVNSSRSTNKLEPNTGAQGDHSSIKRDGSGKTTNTATYEKNANNPSGFQEKKRVDVTGKAHGKVETPHVHENGNVRPAKKDDLPNQ